MSAVPKEIVYQEVSPGQIVTRAEVRRQKRAQKKRAEEREDFWLQWGGVLITSGFGLVVAALLAVDVMAPWIWPAR